MPSSNVAKNLSFYFDGEKSNGPFFSSVSLSYLNSFLFQMQPSAKVICGYFAESLCRFWRMCHFWTKEEKIKCLMMMR
jgi:hypothetical protein